MVECFLAKEDVAGSTPVSRSNNLNLNHLGLGAAGNLSKGRGTQVVRERSAKPLCVGSIPTRASNIPSDLGPAMGLFLGSEVGGVFV